MLGTRILLTVFFSSLLFSSPQVDMWQHVSTQETAHLKQVTPNPLQLVAIKRALKERENVDVPDCAEQEPNWTGKVIFEELLISSAEKAVLVEVGPGCARGLQGANGAMWIVRVHADKVSFVATPEQSFFGWLYSIQRTTSHGLRDVVVAQHGGATDSELSYFKFDGTLYRLVGTADLFVDQDGIWKITQKR